MCLISCVMLCPSWINWFERWKLKPCLHRRSSTLPLKTAAIPKEESRPFQAFLVSLGRVVSSPGLRNQWPSELSSCDKVIHYIPAFNLHDEEPPKKWKFHWTSLIKKNRWLTYPLKFRGPLWRGWLVMTMPMGFSSLETLVAWSRETNMTYI